MCERRDTGDLAAWSGAPPEFGPVMPEAAALVRALDGTVSRLMAILSEFDEADRRWRPDLPASNCLAVIAQHVLANVERNVIGTYARRPYVWDRDAEFRLAPDAADPASVWRELRRRIDAAVEEAGHEAVDAPRDHPRLGEVPGHAVLIQALRHAAEHLGEAELTRTLLMAARGTPRTPSRVVAEATDFDAVAERIASSGRPFVAGVDGCPKGWVAAIVDLDEGVLGIAVVPDFAVLLERFGQAASIAIDVPIGLPDGPTRRCDVLARAELPGRGSTIFPAPCRQVLECADYPTALATVRAATGKGMSAQAFGIVRKVREVDGLMTPYLQQRVHEAHPEMAFAEANGGVPLRISKRLPEGFDQRAAVIKRIYLRLGPLPGRALIRAAARGAAPDDVLDAIILTRTALRVVRGEVRRFPADTEERDARGLRMEIVV